MRKLDYVVTSLATLVLNVHYYVIKALYYVFVKPFSKKDNKDGE